MFRFTKALALAAVAASAMLFTNLTPALAANTTVYFRVKNVDPSESMKLAATPPSTISGYLPVGTQNPPGRVRPIVDGTHHVLGGVASSPRIRLRPRCSTSTIRPAEASARLR